MEEPKEEVRARVERLIGAQPRRWERVDRGYTQAERWIVNYDSGSAFIKVGTVPHSRDALRKEHALLERMSASFLPRLVGWEDGGEPVIVLEDLSHAHWPPPWNGDLVAQARRMLDAVAAHPAPPGLKDMEERRSMLTKWMDVAKDPEPFLRLGFASEAWLDHALPSLLEAEARARLVGDQLCHFDVRSDNMCFAGARTVLVDWNGASVGNAMIDVVAWAPSLHFEGGPAPEEVVGDEPELAALVSGYFAWHAGQPSEEWSGFERIRRVQRQQLSTALPWAARALRLAPPDGPINQEMEDA